MTHLLWLQYPECVLTVRISSRKAAYKAPRNSCSQVRAKQQQMKASKIGRWKLRGNTTVLLLHACLSSKQTKSRWTWRQIPAQDSELCCRQWTTNPGRWKRAASSTSFSQQGLAVLLTWGYSKDLVGALHPTRFSFYSMAEKPKHGEVYWLLKAKLHIPMECNPSSSILCAEKLDRKI